MADPTQQLVDPTDPNQTIDQSVTTPNLELFNPKPNAWQIIGDVLSKRRGLLSSLGGGFMSDYGRRKSAEREIPAFEKIIAQEQGSPIAPEVLKQIGQMDPENALQELSIMQAKAMKAKAAAHQGVPGLWWNKDKKQYEYLPKEGVIGQQYIPAAQELAAEKKGTGGGPPKSPWQALYASQDPSTPPEQREIAKRAYDKYVEDQKARMAFQDSIGTTLRMDAQNANIMKLPWNQNPHGKGTVPVDKRTGAPLRGLTTADVYNGYNKGTIGITREADLPALRNIQSIGHTLDTLDRLGEKLLPLAQPSGLKTTFATQINAWKLWAKGLSDPDAKQFIAVAGTALPLQIQKLLTGSTRPVNLVEFQRITGTPLKAGAFNTESEQVKALTPTPYDTVEQKRAKIKFLKQLEQDQMSQLIGAPPAPTAYEFRNDNPDDSPDRTGVEDGDPTPEAGGEEGTDF